MLRERTEELFDPKALDQYRIKKRDQRLKGWKRWQKIRGKKTPVFSCHDANACVRKLCFELEPDVVKPEPMDWQGCLRVYDGEPHGDSLVHWLTELGYKVTDREKNVRKMLQTPAGPIGVSGRIDGIIEIDGEQYILEMKGLSTWTMKKSPEDVVNKDYRYQAQAYMWLSGIHRAMFVVKDKNNSQFKFYELGYNQRVIKELKTRWLKVVKAHQDKQLLNREYAYDSLQCSWCGFRERCWK